MNTYNTTPTTRGHVRVYPGWRTWCHKYVRRLEPFLLVAILVLTLPATRPAFGADAARLSTAAASACSGRYHTVRGGQTLYSIAALYGTSAYRIVRCNGLYSYTIYTGQALLIPTGR